jgi:hypothetical protein
MRQQLFKGERVSYFEKASEGEKVVCTIYGEGEIVMVCPDCKYAMMVTFEDGTDIPYTLDGVPAIEGHDEQTLFYPGDADRG